MYIVRVASVIFALMNIVGLVWFLDATQAYVDAFGVVAIICALLVSMTPRKLLGNEGIKATLIALCIAGICALVALIAKDYQREYGPDYGAIMLRALFAYTFVAMGLDLYSKRSPDGMK
ncbi:MAG: hypothetical protein HY941_09490 [Gammaproteobacteria bacterium]|nr:hypothetical protein [Gammaproteobacteria bacterium]